MKHRFWTKIVATGLVILGEGAFASESYERSDDRDESIGSAFQLSQVVVLGEAISGSQPFLASANSIQPDIKHTTNSFTAVTSLVLDLLKYHPFNPRAPPILND